jgi:NADP-dependent 3-hydroxy acid dehydrogenase YdfG
MQLTGKTILITGASSGLGRALAVALGQRNNNLIVTARREERLDALALEVIAAGSRCTVVAGDATDTATCRRVIDEGVAAYGQIDVAILNAGGASAKSMAEAGVDHVLWIMRLNYDTLVNFLCPLIAHMKPHGGVIAYTGSPAGSFGLPRSGPYSAAKAAGHTLLDACRIELAGTDLRFVSLYPGFTYTEGLDPDEVPVKSLIIDQARAVKEMVGAIERGRAHHMFPKRIKGLISLGRMLPEPVRRWVLQRAAGT